MKVIIQGAGIAGLTLARELSKIGIDCLIIERAAKLQPVGAGITLGSNALERLGRTLDVQSLIRKGISLEDLRVADHLDRTILRNPGSLPGIPHATLAIHRHALHEALLAGLPAQKLRLGTRIDSFEQDTGGVKVRMSDGQVERCDFLIGADGLHSEVRAALFPSIKTRFSGYTCWRAVIPFQLKNSTSAIEMWGTGRRVGLVPIGKGQLYFFSTLNVSQELHARGQTNLPINDALDQYRDFGGEVPEILECLRQSGSLIHNDLEEIELPHWHVGRVLLIGDAAHAMTPNLGQGAGMGIEDASALAEIWQADPSVQSLEVFERARRPRVDWIQRKSREMGILAQQENPSIMRLRNSLLRLVPGFLVERNFRQVVNPRA